MNDELGKKGGDREPFRGESRDKGTSSERENFERSTFNVQHSTFNIEGKRGKGDSHHTTLRREE